jgi:hypothetical protein
VIYEVIWTETAEQDLATVWMTYPDRNAVTQSAAIIDQRLGQNGPQEGESRPGNRRITIEAPLGVSFEFDAADQTVYVLHV